VAGEQRGPRGRWVMLLLRRREPLDQPAEESGPEPAPTTAPTATAPTATTPTPPRMVPQ
jgi:hypothetical protein